MSDNKSIIQSCNQELKHSGISEHMINYICFKEPGDIVDIVNSNQLSGGFGSMA